MERYNGWANYATWRVNLELIDDNWDYWSVSLEEMEGEDEADIQYTLTQEIEEYVQQVMDANDPGDDMSNLIRSYADAFLADVSYYEIAKHLIEQYELEKQEA
tara:strand:+ start:1059 stop:1367 length:309 start_codon:yes stop_codon:yes gene_type:complete